MFSQEAGQTISKWELTEEEKAHIAEHGYIFINVLGGIQPPIMPAAQKELPLISTTGGVFSLDLLILPGLNSEQREVSPSWCPT